MRLVIAALLWVGGTGWALAQTSAPQPEASPAPSDPPAETVPDVPATEVDPAALYETGKALWDSYMPEDLKDDYAFPSREEWDAFFIKIQSSLDQESISEVAKLEPEIKQAVASLHEVPVYSEYLDWLEERLDFAEVAKLITEQEKNRPSPLLPKPGTPTPSPAPPSNLASIPHYPLWLERLRSRPAPSRAAALMPRLKAAFEAEGLPPALAWIAEVESSLNPSAKSPAGAFGLFQLMPTTAQSLGLSTFPFDERSHPDKSAQAAARYLKKLYKRFGNWPLALAAYNAGDGRVSRALKKHGPDADFAAIAPSLSVETRMYVPKVLATVNVREGVELASLNRPARTQDIAKR